MAQFEPPTEIRHERSIFDRFAEASSRIVGEAAFFTAAFVLVVGWLPLVAARPTPPAGDGDSGRQSRPN
jgi:hypothetical protein